MARRGARRPEDQGAEADVLASAEKALAEARAHGGGGGEGVGAMAGGDRLGAAPGAGYTPPGGGGRPLATPISQLEVSFPANTAPAPSFAGVCVVHRFPEYILLDFGSIDPLQVEQTPAGQKALLQHVGRICLPEQTARRLLADLTNLYGPANEG